MIHASFNAANIANFLWDMRDLVSSGARESVPREEWTAYMEWRAALITAEKRGLPNLKTTVDCLPVLTDKATVNVFERYGVLTKRELQARKDIASRE